MDGLRILLEEPKRSPDLQGVPFNNIPITEGDVSSISPVFPVSPKLHGEDETLLPPLPESELEGSLSIMDTPLKPSASTFTSFPLGVVPSLSHITSTPPATAGYTSDHATRSTTHVNKKSIDSENISTVLESHAQDSSTLSIDSPPLEFPSLDFRSSSALSLSLVPSIVPSSAPEKANVSPLRRLKSIKNGIRKLSLSRIGSSISISSPQSTSDLPASTQTGARPSCSPTNSEFFANHSSSSSFGSDSIYGTSTNASTPQVHSHSHTSSMGSNGSFSNPKTRCRTFSLSASTALAAPALTPPLPSPVVTMSENLASTKKNLASIEQTFFENLSLNHHNTDSFTQRSARRQSGSHGHSNGHSNSRPNDKTVCSSSSDADKISGLNSPDDLLEYSSYLIQHKKSVESAYEASKNRLICSGWCSGHDIENLNLQRDASISQIDSKLLQIEAKLNSDFNISFLNNKQPQRATSREKYVTSAPMSPSLKDLENTQSFHSPKQLGIF